MAVLIGTKKIDFTNKDGERVTGVRYFFTEEFDQNERDCTGSLADSFFLNSARIERLGLKDFPLGSEFSLLYDKKGKIKKVDVSDVVDY